MDWTGCWYGRQRIRFKYIVCSHVWCLLVHYPLTHSLSCYRLTSTAPIYSQAEYSKYECAIPIIVVLPLSSPSISSFALTENDGATIVSTMYSFCLAGSFTTFTFFFRRSYPKLITSSRVEPVCLTQWGRGGDGTSALWVVGVKSNFPGL